MPILATKQTENAILATSLFLAILGNNLCTFNYFLVAFHSLTSSFLGCASAICTIYFMATTTPIFKFFFCVTMKRNCITAKSTFPMRFTPFIYQIINSYCFVFHFLSFLHHCCQQKHINMLLRNHKNVLLL